MPSPVITTRTSPTQAPQMQRHPLEGADPCKSRHMCGPVSWVPASAGMTLESDQRPIDGTMSSALQVDELEPVLGGRGFEPVPEALRQTAGDCKLIGRL